MEDFQKRLVDSAFVMEALGVSRATVYRIIRELNGELHEKGVRTIDGRVDRDYLLSKYFAPTDGSEA